MSLMHQESKRRAMLAAVLEQELPTLAEQLCLERDQVGGPPQRPLVVAYGQKSSRRPPSISLSRCPASLSAQMGIIPLSFQDPRLGRNHVEELLRCLGAHIHTPNRRQLAQELQALQGQLRAQGIGPALLHAPLFAFPEVVRRECSRS